MAFKFDPEVYKNINAGKPLPVILLLDVSGSMRGDKIENLKMSVKKMIDSFVDAITKETIIEVAIITFGATVEPITYHDDTPYIPVEDFQKQGIPDFVANGMTPLGMALKMAKDIIEDKETTPSKSYKPAVVLVSDGEPNDSWEQPLADFINSGRTQKAQRLAVAIGNDVNMDVLERFTNNPSLIYTAENANEIESAFKKVTMSISMRTASKNPNEFLSNVSSQSKPIKPVPVSRPISNINDDDDDF